MTGWKTMRSCKSLSNPKINLQITMQIYWMSAVGKYGWRLDKLWLLTDRGVSGIARGESETLKGAQEAAEKKARSILF